MNISGNYAKVVGFAATSLVCALVVFVVGCARTPQYDALAVWRSPTSSPEQRLDAVARLIPVGMTGAEVRRTLGEQGVWTHWHGPSANLSMENGAIVARSTEDHNYWTLEYQIPGGWIALFFEGAAGKLPEQLKFVIAGFRKNLEPVSDPLKQEAR